MKWWTVEQQPMHIQSISIAYVKFGFCPKTTLGAFPRQQRRHEEKNREIEWNEKCCAPFWSFLRRRFVRRTLESVDQQKTVDLCDKCKVCIRLLPTARPTRSKCSPICLQQAERRMRMKTKRWMSDLAGFEEKHTERSKRIERKEKSNQVSSFVNVYLGCSSTIGSRSHGPSTCISSWSAPSGPGCTPLTTYKNWFPVFPSCTSGSFTLTKSRSNSGIGVELIRRNWDRFIVFR